MEMKDQNHQHSNAYCPQTRLVDPPKISIVTPNYNYGHFIEATLRSVIDQDYPNLEYIILDDGSVDNSVGIIRQYETRLTHWETGANRGQYQVINAAFKKSTGAIMGWINSDDMHLPWTLLVVAEVFTQFPEVQWISSLAQGHWDYRGYCLGFHSVHGFNRMAFLDGHMLPTCTTDPASVPGRYRQLIQQESTFWRRSLWDKAGAEIPLQYGAAGDFALWTRFFEHANLVGVACPLAGFRMQNQQQTSQMEKYGLQCRAALHALRERIGWRQSAWRSLFYRTRAWHTPKVGHRLIEKYGYPGQMIVRKDANTPHAHWELTPHRFI
jgi:hypothetical protein